MNRIISEELKPCPFCGGVAKEEEAELCTRIACQVCWAEARTVEDWNTRTLATALDLSGLKSSLQKFTHLYGVVAPKDIDAFLGFANAHLATLQPPSGQVGEVVGLPDFEDALESAFWDFDARHKATNGPSERDAFKQVLRGLFSAGIDPESRGLRAELLARRMEVESQSKIIEALRQPVETVDNWDWKSVAFRLGEDIGRTGPDGYYSLTPDQWLDWARKEYEALRTQPQAPVVEVLTREEIDQAISDSDPDGEHFGISRQEQDRILNAILALLQSKGGR